MGYPAFNLTTIQLPAPTSNLTKAEYKATYGIDLDAVNIKSFKLVIFGNDKYAIDQIKEVEDGYEIYFNGRILSITDIVQTSDEVYDVANAKPIYYHGILLQSKTSGALYTMCLKILNNSPSLINSWAKLLAVFDSLPDSSIIELNGFYNYNNEEISNTAFLYITGNTLVLVGNKSDSTRTQITKSKSDWGDIFGEADAAVQDKMNIIN